MSRALTVAIALSIALLAGLAAKPDLFYRYLALVLPLDAKPAESIPELALKEAIQLGDVKGRIDHMAVDPGRKRLFVAELGNNSLGVVDLQGHRVETRITDLDEPQGVAFVPAADTVFIANGGSGAVQMRRGGDLSLIRTINLGDDADNIRTESEQQVVVGFGKGALAVLDAKTGERRQDIVLAAHPESFQLDRQKGRIFVNELQRIPHRCDGSQVG